MRTASWEHVLAFSDITTSRFYTGATCQQDAHLIASVPFDNGVAMLELGESTEKYYYFRIYIHSHYVIEMQFAQYISRVF